MKTHPAAAYQRAIRRSSRSPTISDVARLAGVSSMTVSRVINDGHNVLPDTRAKVKEAISELGYVPNPAARSLAGARQSRIAIVHSNPSAAYLSEFLVGGLSGAARSDAQLLVEHWSLAETPDDLVTRLSGHRIDGVLLPPPLCEDAALLAALAKADIACAQIATGRPSPNAFARLIDDHEAARTMTARLLEMGHRRIGFVCGDPNQTASWLRRDGYEQALRDADLAVDTDLIVAGDFTYRSGLAAADILLRLKSRPTAVFASNDDMAAAVVSVAHRLHLDVPNDLSVCGFDDTAMATTVWPELTTIRQPIAEMAAETVALLAKAARTARTGATAEPNHRKVPFELVERGSACPRRPD